MRAEENMELMQTLVSWPGGQPPTHGVVFCTVARWDNGQIVGENLFYDMPGMMAQLGLGG
jgi:hypothetical protein